MVSFSPQEGFEWLAGHEALDVAYKKISLVRNVIGKPKRNCDNAECLTIISVYVFKLGVKALDVV